MMRPIAPLAKARGLEDKVMISVAPPTEGAAAPAQGVIDAGIVLKLRRHMHGAAAERSSNSAEWRAEYLRHIDAVLRSAGLCEDDCAPLREIAEAITAAGAPAEEDHDAKWAGQYAKECAAISYLILTGVREDDAAQRVARELVARGIPLPEHGGDSRGWKRLLKFRDKIRQRMVPQSIAQIYRDELNRLRLERQV